MYEGGGLSSREAVNARTDPLCGVLLIGTARKAGLRSDERIIQHDQDTVHRWPYAMRIKHRARISYSGDGAKGKTAMESFFGRFKPEDVSLFHKAVHIRSWDA
jgi:hypothetical protein